MSYDYLRYGSTIGADQRQGRVGIHHMRNATLEGLALYPFTSAYFTVSRSLSSSYSSSAHRYGPTQTEVRNWLSCLLYTSPSPRDS